MQAATNRGHFKRGYDPRRRQFTPEECREYGRKGYQAAFESIARRYPGADPHFLMCALIGSKPLHHFLPDRNLDAMTDAQLDALYAR